MISRVCTGVVYEFLDTDMVAIWKATRQACPYSHVSQGESSSDYVHITQVNVLQKKVQSFLQSPGLVQRYEKILKVGH